MVLFRFLVFVLATVVLVGCGGSAGSHSSNETQWLVTSAGGTFTKGITVQLNVPAGAVASNTAITVRSLPDPGTAPSGTAAVPNSLWSFSHAVFTKSATLVLTYDPLTAPEGTVPQLYRREDGESDWKQVDATVDAEHRTVTASILGSSSYGLFYRTDNTRVVWIERTPVGGGVHIVAKSMKLDGTQLQTDATVDVTNANGEAYDIDRRVAYGVEVAGRIATIVEFGSDGSKRTLANFTAPLGFHNNFAWALQSVRRGGQDRQIAIVHQYRNNLDDQDNPPFDTTYYTLDSAGSLQPIGTAQATTKLLPWVSDLGASADILANEAETNHLVLLTPARRVLKDGGFGPTVPRFSPSGNYVLYAQEVPDAHSTFRVINLSGTVTADVPGADWGRGDYAAWGKDDNQVVYQQRLANGENQFVVVDLRTGKTRNIGPRIQGNNLILRGVR